LSLLPRQIISFSLVNKKKLYHTRLWPVELAMSWLHKTATIYKITSRLNVFSIKIYNITSLLDTFPLIVLFGCGCCCMVVGCTTTCVVNFYHHWSCEFEPRSWRGVLDTTLCDKVCQWLVTGRWFYPDIQVSSSNKNNSHDMTEILLKVSLNTINHTYLWSKSKYLLCRYILQPLIMTSSSSKMLFEL
jgi:hypothetical protein